VNQSKQYLTILWLSLSLALLVPIRTSAANLFIIVEGVEAELEKNVLSYMTINQEKDNKKLGEDRIRRYFQMGNQEIKDALKPFGYYHTFVQSEIKQQDNEWRLYYKITPGPSVKISEIDIRVSGTGETESQIQEVITKFPLKFNDTAIHALYEQGKTALLRATTAQSYLDAKYSKSQLIIDPQTNKATIHLHLETGDPYFFGKIKFQAVKIKESLLRRYLEFKEGDRYSGKAVLELQAALESSSYFATVAVIPERDLATNYKIPIKVELSMNKPNKYDLGAGYGTDTGIRGRVRWNRRVLGSHGHTFDVQATVSQIKQEGRISYYIPWRNPRNNRIEIGAGLQNKETVTYDSIDKSLGTSLQLKYRKWRETNSLHLEETQFNVGEEGWRITQLLVLGTSLTQLNVDNYKLIRHGTKYGFGLLGSWDQALSDISFLRAEVSGKLILGLTKHGRVLLRGKLGAMTVSDFDLLPPKYRYFAGGDSSIRGYEYESQGPTNEFGKVIGGQRIIETSVEFDYAIGENWRAAVFWDGGNAFDARGDPMIQGAGVGVRYVLPIGMVRVDVAQAISEPDKPWRVHITIGPDL